MQCQSGCGTTAWHCCLRGDFTTAVSRCCLRSSLKFYRRMAMTTWLLLSLLTVQTLMSEGLSHRDFIYARGTMEDELENWLPKGK